MSEEAEKVKPNFSLDYNYPSLNRRDGMYLSTITSRDAPIRKFKQLDTKRDWSINLYNLDIEGSSPRRIGAFNQKIDYTNKNDDIERSCPKLLHVGLNKPEYNLRNDDIEFSMPGCVKIKTTRHLNPLEPKYSLPKSEALPFEVPKFIRDNIQISDIEGAKSRQIMSKWKGRESLKKDDIEKSSPRKPYVRNTVYHSIDYRDVTNAEFKTGRMTNPLEPVYRLGYVTGEKVQVGPIDGSKPVTFSKYKYEDPFNLKVNDILGSNTGSKNYINKFTGQNFMYTSSDIFGAQANTLKKGIVTNRHLNPLVPKYKYLGTDELNGSVDNNPYDRKRQANTTIPGKKSIKVKPEDTKVQETTPITKRESPRVSQDTTVKEKRETSLPPKRSEGLNLEGLPYVEDTVHFDKEKFVRPKPFYGFVHDKYLIPPIEEYKKKKITPTVRTFQETSVLRQRMDTENKLKQSKVEPEFKISQPKQTYAQKLDQFMTESNLRFIEPEPPKPKVVPQPEPVEAQEGVEQPQPEAAS